MGIRSLIAVFAICFAGSAFAAVPPLPPLNFGVKSFGVLVLGEGEAPQWTETAQEISTAFTARFPVEFAYGLADKNSMQHAISRLEAQKVAKIVVVPLFFSSNAHVLKQVRYLLGIGKKPSTGLFKTYQALAGSPVGRLTIHVPIVLMPTLDYSPVFPKILVEHAEAGNTNRRNETLVLVSESPASSKNSRDWKMNLKILARHVKKKAGFKNAAVFLLQEGVSQADAEKSESSFEKNLRGLRLQGPIWVVPLELAPDLVTTRLSRMLSGLLVGYNDQTLLPNPFILSWVQDAAELGAKQGDMRRFKEKEKTGFMDFPKMEIK